MFNFTNGNTKCGLKLYVDTRLAKIKKTKNTKCYKKSEYWNSFLWWEWKWGQPHWKITRLNINTEILCLGAYSTEINKYAPQKKCQRICKAALFIITIHRKQIKYLSIIEWINYVTEQYRNLRYTQAIHKEETRLAKNTYERVFCLKN